MLSSIITRQFSSGCTTARLWWVILCIGFYWMFSTTVMAQSTLDDVHVSAKGEPHPQNELAPRPLKVDVNLVLVPVTVTDESNRVVLGLQKSNFQVYENKQLQSVEHFSQTDTPVSVGIILDTSGSMTTKIDRARDAVRQFLNTANPQDEFFMITLADTPTDLVDFTTSPDEITHNLIFTRTKGSTALLDAIYLGVSKMRGAKHTKKAILIISDGGDNHSRYTEKDVRRAVKEADVAIYTIGVYDHYFRTEEERLGPELLNEVTELTGGRSFTVENPNDLPDVAGKIAVELRNQYVLGYRPTAAAKDGKWHKIRIKLLPPRGLPRLQVSSKQGYYAQEQ